MPWSAGIFSRVDGANTWINDRDAGIKILASLHDTHDQDLSDGINNALTKDGSNSASGNINLGGNKLVNVGTPTAGTDAVNKTYADAAAGISLVAGNQILFRGAATPSGWSIAAQDNKALRIVSGVPSSGGTNAFTTALNSARTSSSESGHTHTVSGSTGTGTTTAEAVSTLGGFASANTHTHSMSFTSGAGSAHSHTLNVDVQYYDMNLIQKS